MLTERFEQGGVGSTGGERGLKIWQDSSKLTCLGASFSGRSEDL